MTRQPTNRLTAAKSKGAKRLTLTAIAAIQPATEADQVPRFELDAYSGGIMYPELSGVYWDGPVVISIDGISVRDDVIPVHRSHDTDRPVGHGNVELGERIKCSGVFSIDNADSREILAGAKGGFPWRASVGLSNMMWVIAEPGQSVEANGKTYDGPILHVISADLDEVSFVTIAGDPNVSPAIAANKRSGVTLMNFSQWLAAKGWDESTLSAAQLSQLQGVFDAEQQAEAAQKEADAAAEADETEESDDDATETDDDATPADVEAAELVAARKLRAKLLAAKKAAKKPAAVDPSVARIRAAAAKEETRIAAIREIGDTIGNPAVEGTSAKLVAHAIAQGWDATQTALYATRNSRPRGPAIHSTATSERGSLESLQAGILLRAGRNIDAVLPAHHSIPDWMSRPVNDPNRQRVMDNAQQFRDMEMVEYIGAGLQAMGHSRGNMPQGRSGRLATLQAGFSTGATAAIFTQSIGALALATYMESGDFSQGWTSEADVPNLIETDRPRMQAGQDLTLHETGGEATHSSRAATNEKVKADRYSRTAEIDENDFINDRFHLLREQPVAFGRAAARLRPNMVAAVLMANANLSDSVALFEATAHKNLLTSSALSATTLRAARAALSKQKDGDSSLNLPATHLIVPSDLGDLAVQLTMSAVISNDTGAGSTNPLHMRNIRPVEEARLSNGVINPLTGASIGGSLTSWYLVSAEGHTIEVQFLEGTGRVPQVIVTQLTGGKFGLSITVKHFIGAKALDFRGMVKANA